ncbi:MAG: peroxidase [Phycisphaeraceae bacterium]|nr:hypothetical protein [Phycisphaerales bacterium]MCB9861396.1 peroxidase [Phycisphaeraceae bacterium]
MKIQTFSIVALVACCGTASAQYRTINGSGNNVQNLNWGSVGMQLNRMGTATYGDGIGSLVDRGNVRSISNILSTQTAAPNTNTRQLSSMFWQWGQFLDHDITLISEGPESAAINIPAGDPYFDPFNTGTQTMPFHRSAYINGVSSPREHQNEITHWIDGSMVYGSDTTRASALREFSGGRMLMDSNGYLPKNTAGLPNAGSSSPDFYLAGDVRANEQTGLLGMHTVFVREHNYWADRISQQNPFMNDEEIYQTARKVVGAEIQSITYNEWLPSLLGGHGLGSYSGYDSTVNPNLSTEFSAAAFRFGHSMLNDQLLRIDANGQTYAGGHLDLAASFFNPSLISEPGSLDAVMRGLAFQEANEIDTQAVDAVRNMLFGPPGAGGLDLISLNIQRGRDHGVSDYNTLRETMGLTRVADFAEITSDPILAQDLSVAYGTVDNIDAWIGLMAEDHLSGASVGETMAAIFTSQFYCLREGDSYFYLNDPLLQGLVGEIDATSLADVLMRTTAVGMLQGNVFVVPAPGVASVLVCGGVLAGRRRRRA